MRSYVALFFVSAVLSALLTPGMRALAFRLGAVSHPGGRNVNDKAVPRFGGIAICLAFLGALGMLYASEATAAAVIHAEKRRLIALVLGGVGLCVVGVVDDTRRMRALHKLYAQIAAALVAYALGFRIETVLLPFIGGLSMGVFALPVTVVWIVGVTNAINLIDGLDGLAGGVVVFAAITNLIVAHVTGAPFIEMTMLAILGSVMGFLLFNFNPARIFMGDSGSYFLGFVLGTMSLAGAAQKASTTVSLLVPVLALGLPIVDTSLAMMRRFLERRPLFSPDRGHIHHRLLDMGLTHRRAVLILYGVCILFTVAAVGVSLGHNWTVGVAILGAVLVVIAVGRFVGSYEYRLLLKRQRSRLRTREVELLRALLPDVPGLLAGASSEEDVWRTLRRIAERAEIGSCEVLQLEPQDVVFRFGNAEGQECVFASFPLGAEALARAKVRFGLSRDGGAEVSPQVDVLLQVVVDILAGALTRTASPRAPRAAHAPPAVHVTAHAGEASA